MKTSFEFTITHPKVDTGKLRLRATFPVADDPGYICLDREVPERDELLEGWGRLGAEMDGALGDMGGRCAVDGDDAACDAYSEVERLIFKQLHRKWPKFFKPETVELFTK